MQVIFGLFWIFLSSNLLVKMKSRIDGASRGQKAKGIQGEGPNWILIACGALLSTLSIRIGYKLKQTIDSKQQSNADNALKGLLLSVILVTCLQFATFSNSRVVQVVEKLLTGGGHQVTICKQTCIPLCRIMMVASTAFQVWKFILCSLSFELHWD